jgi:formyl-CoA transferase
MRILGEAGVPCSAIMDTRDLFEDPHLRSRGFVHELHHEAVGPIRLLGWAPRMSESTVPLKAAPLLGQHSGEVVGADLEMGAAEVAALFGRGILARPG